MSNLLLCAQHDAERRFVILNEELDRLRLSAFSVPGGNEETRFQTESLRKAVELLHCQVYDDLTAVVEVGKWWLCNNNSPYISTENERGLTDLQFMLICQAGFRTVAADYCVRLGDLHDRLDQSRDGSNPDHPAPRRRRRHETAFSEAFLAEHARWVYRDISRFLLEISGANFPNGAVPYVFQQWYYGPTSAHRSLAGKMWRNERRKRYEKFIEQPEMYPQKYVMLRMPFWTPDAPDLYPIIGHELAHEVLDDYLGWSFGQADLAKCNDVFTVLLHNIYCDLSQYLIKGLGLLRPDVISITRELACDLLAFARFKGAYVYSFFLMMLDVEEWSHALLDIDGDQIDLTALADNISQHQKFDCYKIELALRLQEQSKGFPSILLRARLLCSLLQANKQCGTPFDHQLSIDLYNAVDSAESMYFLGDEGKYREKYKYICDRITTTLCGRNGFLRLVRKWWEKEERSSSDNGTYCYPKDYFLRRQNAPLTFLDKHPGGIDRRNHNWSLSDEIWTRQWCRMLSLNAASAYSKQSLFVSMRDESDHKVLHLLKEDYLLRTVGLIDTNCSLPDELLKRGDEANPNTMSSEQHYECFTKPMEDLLKFLLSKINSCDDGAEVKVHDGKAKKVVGDSLINYVGNDPRPFDVNGIKVYRLLLINIAPNNPLSYYNNIARADTGPFVVLGRYDIGNLIAFDKASELITSSNVTNGFSVDGETSESAAEDSVGGGKVISIRDRELVEVLKLNSPRELLELDNRKPLSLFLVGLKGPTMRRVFCSYFIKYYKEQLNGGECNKARLFLSEGWEDIIIMLYGSESLSRDLDSIKKLLRDLNKNPLVAGTETLLTDRIWSIAEADEDVVGSNGLSEKVGPSGLNIRMRCRSKIGATPDIDKIRTAVNEVVEHMDGIDARVSALLGLTDYEVALSVLDNNCGLKNFIQLAKGVLDKLYDENLSIIRFQTQFGFDILKPSLDP